MRVSVVTATWRRHDLLIGRCVPAVAAQTIDVQHVIVSDGPDPELGRMLAGLPVTYGEMPVHAEPGGCGRAYNHAAALATGDYIALCDDDNALRPEHCARLAAALDESGADFAYSQVFRHGIGDVVGSDPPYHGGIDGNALMWRRDTLARFGGWPEDGERTEDWRTVSRWLRNGACYVHVPEVTVDYYYHPASASWRAVP